LSEFIRGILFYRNLTMHLQGYTRFLLYLYFYKSITFDTEIPNFLSRH
jgi:hypothetical protein